MFWTQDIVVKNYCKNFLRFSQTFLKKFLHFHEWCDRIYKHSAAMGELCPSAVCDMRWSGRWLHFWCRELPRSMSDFKSGGKYRLTCICQIPTWVEFGFNICKIWNTRGGVKLVKPANYRKGVFYICLKNKAKKWE